VWTNGPPEHRELGKKVWSATMQIPAQQQGSFELAYRVPGVVRQQGPRSVYRLVLQHQAKVRPETITITVTLPPGAKKVKAPGFKRAGGGNVLVWRHTLTEDEVLTASWQS
jgi:hypothetical protein